MDFIESFFRIAPDHHYGSLEAMLLTMLVIAIAGMGLAFFRKYHVRD